MVNTSGTSPNLHHEQFKTALREAVAVLESGFEERFGYPIDPGSNRVTDAGKVDQTLSKVHLPEELRAFYASVGEIELPDVHIGYFIHSAATIGESVERMLPTRLESDSAQLGIVTFGSDGGGGLFAIGLNGGAIYYLPGGTVEAGVYRGGLEVVRVVFQDFQTFLDQLLSMTSTFAETGTCRGF